MMGVFTAVHARADILFDDRGGPYRCGKRLSISRPARSPKLAMGISYPELGAGAVVAAEVGLIVEPSSLLS